MMFNADELIEIGRGIDVAEKLSSPAYLAGLLKDYVFEIRNLRRNLSDGRAVKLERKIDRLTRLNHLRKRCAPYILSHLREFPGTLVDQTLISEINSLEGEVWRWAEKIAEAIWQNAPPAGLLTRRCSGCMAKWRDHGRQANKYPPSYPATYEGVCLVCGSELGSPRPVI